MIAKPFSQECLRREEVAAGTPHVRYKAMIGSCTNGGYEDLLSDRPRAVGRARAGISGNGSHLHDLSGVRGVAASDRGFRIPAWRRVDRRVFPVRRGQIRQSWCGPCFGQGPDALTTGQRAITSFNRNWQNRMGLGGEGIWRAPPSSPPRRLPATWLPPPTLGIVWNPERSESDPGLRS